MTRYALSPATPVLSRPDGTVQVGWDPRKAVVVRPPAGLPGSVLAELLRALQGVATAPQLQRLAAGHGVDAPVVDGLVAHLITRGIVTEAPRTPVRSVAVRVHGDGPLADLLINSLRHANVRVSHSTRPNASSGRPDLVVLTDYLVADPRLVRDLCDARVPHLPVRVRDGTGLVGPLVIPSVTSCLRCADLHRSDRDAAWPAIAAQLSRTVGNADRATVLATAALALNEIDHIVRSLRPDHPGAVAASPETLDTTLEFDVAAGTVQARRWTRHPDCSC
ncbi:cyclodehydratase [Mycolicibacterium gilvum]|uniref:Cyclodehydratase n=1 Tax=Mycolicibacterium gilvum TaxID=1804 RepID=A0A378SKF3_9MYCO|nr:cyclodehydratase [Mycolicibacterium gilvum]MCV7055062.1 cyclodehydratase [Mycolicibacterium gilvum]STZ42376.1 cyclodehydratase [Mycolicibacterium gilvum]